MRRMTNDGESLTKKRHTLAHLLAAAVRDLYPGAKNAIGPAVDDGFYQDFELPQPVSEADLPKIEELMRAKLKEWKSFDRREVSVEEAKREFSWNQYKTELIGEFAEEGKTLTFYTVNDFVDLCKGGHSEHPADEIAADSFTLDRVAGAYWRGDEKNRMLTRIYGLAFDTKEDLDAYLAQRVEAEKRDHRKLGAELKIFTSSSLVGAGLPLMQPNGAIIRKEIEEYLWTLHADKGYSRVWTPHLAKEDLYITSGHAEKFGDELFRVSGKDERFFLKPMNCPHHMQIFADNQFSYRDMPVRYFEPATVYRDEKSGQLGGLTRVRSITQDDGHLFCRVSQIGEEVSTIVSIIKEFYTTMRMIDGYWVRLSLRGPNGNYLGSDEAWNAAETALTEAAKANELPYRSALDEAAFYGPKLDFIFKDAIGREWQLATIQCDFNLPERFNLSFINEKGDKERPVVIHRAISGSLERFMGVMIEHFAGAFPLWLSPIQVCVLPVSEKHCDYATEVQRTLRGGGVRASLAEANESLGKRIREAKVSKIPYLAVVGDAEMDAQTATLEGRSGKVGALSVPEALALLQREIAQRSA